METEERRELVGRDPAMLEIFRLMDEMADSLAPVLITGESGTGKDLAARAIHRRSRRAEGPFVAVNCGAIPESLLESEMFGHVKGAFTGAVQDKLGRFELADRGTLFLDEIGELPLAMQVKFLRVLQGGRFEAVGDPRPRRADVRLICATNRDLQEAIGAGRFREDLYYRVAVIPLDLPPLRDRPGDIPLIATDLLARLCKADGRPAPRLAPAAVDALALHPWPGNVRELENWLQYALFKCREGEILPAHFPPDGARLGGAPSPRDPARAGAPPPPLPARGFGIDEVRRALVEARGNRAEAARRLGMARSTLYRFIRRHFEA